MNFWYILSVAVLFLLLRLFAKIRNRKFVRKIINYKQTALITGGSEGIGFSFAKLFVEDQFNVVLVSRNQEKLEKAKLVLSKIDPNSKITIYSYDLSKVESVQRLCDVMSEDGIHVDFLVNNVGMAILNKFTETPVDDIVKMINLNCICHLLLTRLLAPKMMEKISDDFTKNGRNSKVMQRIINVGSSSSFAYARYFAEYSATKSLIRSFSFGIGDEFSVKTHGRLHVMVLSPGYVDTELTDYSNVSKSRGFVITKKLGWLSTADECALKGYLCCLNGERECIEGKSGWLNYWIAKSSLVYLPLHLTIVGWTQILGFKKKKKTKKKKQ